jgi:anti-sigma B factor antagonist
VRLADLDVEVQGAIVYGQLRGEIDMSNARELREELSGVTPNHAVGLLLDLSEVDYLDSAGIHLIHYLREDLRASGLHLRLVIPDASPIHDTLRLAGLDWYAEIADSVGDARRALEQTERG